MALKINHNINYLGESLSFECYTVITQLLGDKERLQIKVESQDHP